LFSLSLAQYLLLRHHPFFLVPHLINGLVSRMPMDGLGMDSVEDDEDGRLREANLRRTVIMAIELAMDE
jgi:hypothetical protein